MVLPGALGPWAPGSVAGCQTSGRAYGEAGAQGKRAGPGGSRPPAAPVTCPPPGPALSAAPPRERAGVLALPPPARHPGARPSLPAFSSLSPRPPERLGRGVTSGRSAESFRSRGGRGLAGGAGRGGGAGQAVAPATGARGVQTPPLRPGRAPRNAPTGPAPRAESLTWRGQGSSGRREARAREAEAAALRRRLLAP